MSTFARRIVSGAKARFKDDDLNVDLDLVYVTDRVIIMGYPADGVEAFYRNSRHGARKFLEHRHGLNYWVFNFCPLSENSYPADFFHGHVSRYPFPDHHAPPLAILALATREMDLWLRGDPDRVVVLHCKAGKGRSGTLACSYLLSLEEPPSEPRLERSHSKKEWANKRAEELIDAVTSETEDEGSAPKEFKTVDVNQPPRIVKSANATEANDKMIDDDPIRPNDHVKITDDDSTPPLQTDSPQSMSVASKLSPPTGHKLYSSPPEATASTTSLDGVLALHTSRRMKKPSGDGKVQHRGVSIPSQRRFLYYWSQVLSNAGPPGFWSISPSDSSAPGEIETTMTPFRQVRIRKIKVRMQDLGGAKVTAMKVVNKVLEKAAKGKVRGQEKGKGDVWVSLARYDDGLIETLEQWEEYTRDDPKRMGRRKPGTDHLPEDDTGEKGIAAIFKDGKWDQGKMVRSFGRLGTVSKHDVVESKEDNIRILTHTLHPLPHSEWINITPSKRRAATASGKGNQSDADSVSSDDSVSTLSVGDDLTETEIDEEGIVVDAEREVRAKLYMGQVPMGWFWFIPTFHLSNPSSGGATPSPEIIHFKLKKTDVDFPLGAGAWLLDVDVSMEWVEHQSVTGLPPPRQTTKESAAGVGGEPGGVIAGLGRLNIGGSAKEAMEATQAVNQ